jgi:hypothetical protein
MRDRAKLRGRGDVSRVRGKGGGEDSSREEAGREMMGKARFNKLIIVTVAGGMTSEKFQHMCELMLEDKADIMCLQDV